jgi:membrane-associated protease RseP (regulator of RpoE activity)
VSDAAEATVEQPNYVLHAGLFVATCATTYLAGGFAFAATLMTILVVHEMGHYVAARIHGVEASLPFFVPLPPQISLGTLGAVIRMKNPIQDRNQLIDVGVAGPIAGLVVAIPLLVIGLSLSEVSSVPVEGNFHEGNSILYILLKLAVTGRYLPDGATDVMLHPMAFAAWVGLLITMINLIPIGQLDGGHVARAYLGDRHESFSGYLHWGLLVVGIAVAGSLALSTHRGGFGSDAVLGQAMAGGMPWIVWAVMLLVMRWLSGGIYHPPVGDAPLSPWRRRVVLLTAIIFILIFTPVPLRPVLIP